MPFKSEKGRKGAPVVYSLDAHREFVLGFRKRKQARRQKGKADLEAAEKQARRDVRRQKREFVRSNRERVMGHDSDSGSDDDDDGDDAQITTFAGEGDSVVTAVVTPMDMNNFDAPRRRTGAKEHEKEHEKEGAGKQERVVEKKDDGYGNADVGKLKKRLGVTKTLRKHGKRRVSYTHAMSKSNRRKKQLKTRREANKS